MELGRHSSKVGLVQSGTNQGHRLAVEAIGAKPQELRVMRLKFVAEFTLKIWTSILLPQGTVSRSTADAVLHYTSLAFVLIRIVSRCLIFLAHTEK